MSLQAALARGVMSMSARSIRNDGALANPAIPISSETLASILSGGPTAAGVAVGERSSMRSTAVFACVSLISGLLGSLPLEPYEDGGNGREPAPKHRLTSMLGTVANADIGLTSFIWKELMGVHLNTNGNHYSVIEFDGANRPIGVVPLNPWATEPYRKRREGMGWRRGYRTTLANGEVFDLDQDEVIHVPGLGFDGLKGLSPIRDCARQTVGANLAMEETAGRYLANGARLSGVVTQGPGKTLSPDALNALKAEFSNLYQGSQNAGGVAFIDNGMNFESVQMTLRDAEFLESRKFSVVDIARVFGVPPFLIGETADMTAWGTGLEQIMLAFLLLNLERWLKRIEAELKLKLFNGTRFYPMFDRDALNATNSQGRAEFFAKATQSGWTYNEARRKQHLPKVANGDDPMVPVNVRPLSQASQPVPAPVPA